MDPLLLLLAGLATYRLTRLVTADKITEPLRAWVEARSTFAGYLVTCDWCLSIWVAPIPAVLVVIAPESSIVRWSMIALALSAFTGLLSLAERRLDR